jgi:cysteine desulfurase
VREAGGLLLVDAVPAAGKMALDFALCDYMILSAHKLGGPLGAGALVVADGAPLTAQIVGGAHQRGMRAGSENLSGDAGFGAAAHAVADGEGERARIAHLHDHFEAALKAAFPDSMIFGAKAKRLGNTANVSLPGLKAENIVIALDLEGVMVSSGSSCSSGKISPSHVLVAMGVRDELAGASIRVSFGWNSADEDADAVVASLLRLKSRAKARAA